MALTPPQYKQMKQFLESDQRNKKFSLLQDDLEPGPLKDELLKDFDPSQETYEEYLRRKNLERPFNMADGGMLVKPGFGGVRQGYREEARFKQEGLETRVSNKIRDLIKKKQPINPKTGKVYTMKEYASLTRGQKDKLSSRLRDKFKSKVRSPRLGYYPEKDANKLIEEFMLIANKKVAELFTEIKKQKYIYRVHDLPDNEKLKSLKHIVKSFGYTLDLTSSKGISKSLNHLLNNIR